MTKIFTEDDLIRFIYDDLNPNEKLEIHAALIVDPDLRYELEKLKQILGGLDAIQMSPSQKSVDNILKFSKGFQSKSA